MSAIEPHKRVLPHFEISEQGLRELEIWLSKRITVTSDFPVPPVDTDIDSLILAQNPFGFWKLNESSGNTAFDSSGNGVDLSVDGSGLAPSWGAPAGPPGQQAADFQTGTGGLGGTAGRVARTWAGIVSPFTAGIFINRNTTNSTQVFGQGNPGRGGGSGWMLSVLSAGTSPANRVRIDVANSGTLTVTINADNALAASTWAFIAVTYNGTWKMNVNGVTQSSTSTGAYVPFTSPLWIGQDGGLGGNAVSVPQFVGSYAFLLPSALTDAQLLAIYNSAIVPGSQSFGKALLADGIGGTFWDFPIEVTF